MIISLIAAVDEKGGIGKDNHLPWHLPSDLKLFRSLTVGHHIAMGRKTWETIGKPLPGRTMIVLTRNRDYHPEGCLVVHSLSEAIHLAEGNHETELFIIGGGQIFRQAISLADKIYLTTVHTDQHADVVFPQLDPSEWEVERCEGAVFNPKDEFTFDFRVLKRKQ